jgi:flagellar biosynthesis/type III secretory pathway chaperone
MSIRRLKLDDTVAELKIILEEELCTHRDLLDLSHRERKAIIEGNIDQLQNIVSRKGEIIAHVKTLEERRQQVSAKAGHDLELGTPDITLKDLIEHMDTSQRKIFQSIHDDLIFILKQLGRINRLNARLISRSFEYVDNNIKFFVESALHNTTYGKGGNVTKNRRERKLLDQKV